MLSTSNVFEDSYSIRALPTKPTLPTTPQLHLGTFSPLKGYAKICSSQAPRICRKISNTQSVQKLFIMQNVNFYKKFTIHHMITESHLPVKKGTKAIYSIIEFIVRATELFSKETRRPALMLPWQSVQGSHSHPPTPSRHPILGKASLLRLESGWGQSDVAQLLTSEC